MPPWHWWPFIVPSFCGLYLLTAATDLKRQAFWTGWWFGFGHFLAGLYWVGGAFAVAGTAEWFAPFAVGLMAAAAAFFPAAAMVLWRSVGFRSWSGPFVFASSWVLAEWFRGWLILGGFPWNLTGYALAGSLPLIQFAAVAGIFGLSFVAVLMGVSVAPLCLKNRSSDRSRFLPLAAAIVIGAGLWTSGQSRLIEAPEIWAEDVRLRLVQPNIAQHHKWQNDLRAAHFRSHIALSDAPAELPITHSLWPETAVPYMLDRAPVLVSEIANIVPDGGLIITGLLRGTSEDKPFQIWNSLQAIDDQGQIVANYDKNHLVPFGEYMPFRRLFAALGFGKLTSGSTDFSAGPGLSTLRVPGLPPFSPLICYEVIFPGKVVDPQDRPDWILNITNDGWYGLSAGPHQHFTQSLMRAIEEGIPLVRVANTGISAIVDPYGRITASLGLGELGVVDGRLPARLPEVTLFARFGNGPAILMAVMILLFSLVMTRSTRSVPCDKG